MKFFRGGKRQDRFGAPERRGERPDRQAQRLQELAVLSLFLHSAGTLEEMMALFLERSPRATGASFTYPLLLDRRRDVLTAHHLASVDDPALEAASMAARENLAGLEYPLPLRSWRLAVIEGGEVAMSDDLTDALAGVLSREACGAIMRTLELKRVASVPLVMEGEAFGICLFGFGAEEPDVAMLELLAGHATLALKGIALGQEIARFGGIDPTTWAHSRGYFVEVLEAEIARARRFQREVCVVLFDIDDFGAFNASYGHTTGDRMLRAVAMSLAARLSLPELVARYGGDQFAMLLPESSRAEATLAARAALSDLTQLSIFEDGSPGRVEFSVALVSYPEDGSGREELLAAAEHEMARVKNLTRRSKVTLRDAP